MSSYGDALKRLSGMHRVDQAELASWTGVSAQTITQIVKDQIDPRASTLDPLFAFFGVEPTKNFETVLASDNGRYQRVEQKIMERRDEH